MGWYNLNKIIFEWLSYHTFINSNLISVNVDVELQVATIFNNIGRYAALWTTTLFM